MLRGGLFPAPRVPAQLGSGVGARRELVPGEREKGEGPPWLQQGQKQSSKVPGFLEKSLAQGQFCPACEHQRPLLALGVRLRSSPKGTIPCPPPPPPCAPNVLPSADLFLFYLFLWFFGFFSVSSSAALDRGVHASPVPPSFWGSCLGTWHPTSC